ncbi:hypothetical protein M527_04400 [Sphingobium indicum IP26]|uniref:MgtC/SapB/SrpB/YhiD N-terminal domain-containing protein n=1 Tax=Sphingobium indicum F2 TaxID=1450518 RepID=A0A8E0WVJ4_9SPHN|nr:MgtC/SapB family protein [Sphingobium indicum]EPR11327.1 hypothetical protein M527_04400 [Sphingobium indicum IP26]KER38101.1 hypothetical protein AL00_01870 [Sphingobium indicum F2]
MMILEAAILRNLAASLAVGVLIGIERGWRQRDATDGSRVSGLRTFALLGLAGGIAGLLPDLVAAAVSLAVLFSLVLGYRSTLERQASLSVTNTIVAVITFALGFLATKAMVTEALALAAVTTLILTMRSRAHAILKGMTQAEIESIARFALASLVMFVRVQVLTTLLAVIATQGRRVHENSARDPIDFQPALILAALVGLMAVVGRCSLRRSGSGASRAPPIAKLFHQR